MYIDMALSPLMNVQPFVRDDGKDYIRRDDGTPKQKETKRLTSTRFPFTKLHADDTTNLNRLSLVDLEG
jgi:hypothetical protein